MTESTLSWKERAEKAEAERDEWIARADLLAHEITNLRNDLESVTAQRDAAVEALRDFVAINDESPSLERFNRYLRAIEAARALSSLDTEGTSNAG